MIQCDANDPVISKGIQCDSNVNSMRARLAGVRRRLLGARAAAQTGTYFVKMPPPTQFPPEV